MPDTPDDAQGIASDTRGVRLRRDAVYKRALEVAGATTDTERMELLGMSRATYYRTLRRTGCNLSLAKARRAAGALNWTVDETFEQVS